MLVELWKNHEMCEYEENLPRLCNAGRFSMMFVLYSLYIFPELMKVHMYMHACKFCNHWKKNRAYN